MMLVKRQWFAVLAQRLPLFVAVTSVVVGACVPPATNPPQKDGEADSARDANLLDDSIDASAGDSASIDASAGDASAVDTADSAMPSADVRLDGEVSDTGVSAMDVRLAPDVVDSGTVDVRPVADVFDSSAADVIDSGSIGRDASATGDAAADVQFRDGAYPDVYMSTAPRPADTCSAALVSVPAGGSAVINLRSSGYSYMGSPPNCVDPAQTIEPTNIVTSQRIQIASTSQVTIAMHRGAYSGVVHALAQDCLSAAPTCIVASRYAGIITELLPPGTYEVQKFGGGSTNVWVEPPVAAPTNTRCSAASDVAVGSWTSAGPRVLDAQSRFFRWRTGASIGFVRAAISIRTNASSAVAAIIVRDGCGPTATELARVDQAYLDLTPLTFVPVANREYFIEFANITRGASFDVSIEERL
jgi:hypothetical protein